MIFLFTKNKTILQNKYTKPINKKYSKNLTFIENHKAAYYLRRWGFKCWLILTMRIFVTSDCCLRQFLPRFIEFWHSRSWPEALARSEKTWAIGDGACANLIIRGRSAGTERTLGTSPRSTLQLSERKQTRLGALGVADIGTPYWVTTNRLLHNQIVYLK